MRNIQKVLVALTLCVAGMPALAQFATPTNFIPTTMSEEMPLRFYVGLDSSSLFKRNFEANQSFALHNMQANLAVIYNVGMGFDVGLGLHGGIFSPLGIGQSLPTTLTYAGQTQIGAMFGADLMVRYLAMVSDMFYAGLQAQVGYNYTDIKPGSQSDADYANTGFTSKTNTNSAIPVVAGLVLGVDFKDAASVYLFPAVELGQTSNRTNSTANTSTSPDTGIWKSAVGMQMAVGTAINLGATKLVIQVKPRIANFQNSNSWGLDAGIGAYWDF